MHEEQAAKKANTYFKNSEREDVSAKKIRKKERQVEATKTANLRRLRLEKEAADKLKAEQEAAASGKAPPKPRAARTPARKPTRMVY